MAAPRSHGAPRLADGEWATDCLTPRPVDRRIPVYDLAMSGSYDEVRYQVFVSSTFTDLKKEREKVLQAILESKAFPAGMELSPSADDEQFAFIKREIDLSDYYLVIVAGRYGFLADDGMSFTEKEFDYAVPRGKCNLMSFGLAGAFSK
jgi:Domain of unknown function (DUF4062)